MPTTVQLSAVIPLKRTKRRVDCSKPERPPNAVERIRFFFLSEDFLADVAKSLPDNARHESVKIRRGSKVHLFHQLGKYRRRRRHAADQICVSNYVKCRQHGISKSHNPAIGIAGYDVRLRHPLSIDEPKHVVGKTATTHTRQCDDCEILVNALMSRAPNRRRTSQAKIVLSPQLLHEVIHIETGRHFTPKLIAIRHTNIKASHRRNNQFPFLKPMQGYG